MRVLVTGASGFLGYHLVHDLCARHEVIAVCGSRRVEFGQAKASCCAELRDVSQCARLFQSYSPTHVIHCAALTQTDKCEQDPALAFAVNSQATANLLHCAAQQSRAPFFLQISTDLVFDGHKGYYCEQDPTNPIQVYGRSKLQAELEVSSYGGSWAIMRCALMYGSPAPDRPSFLDWMLKGIRKAQVALFADEYRTPVLVHDAAGLASSICEKESQGIFHCGGSQRLSRLELGELVADVFGLPRDNIKRTLLANTKVSAPRPVDVSLNIAKASAQLGFCPTQLRAALQHIRNQAPD